MINVYEKRVIEHTVNYITIILKKKSHPKYAAF